MVKKFDMQIILNSVFCLILIKACYAFSVSPANHYAIGRAMFRIALKHWANIKQYAAFNSTGMV